MSFKMFRLLFIEMIAELIFNCFFASQSVWRTNIKSPIRKLLVLINQSSFGSLIYFPRYVSTTKEANMQKYTKYTVFDVRRYYLSWFF